MTHDIEKKLATSQPRLNEAERGLLWTQIENRIAKPIPSPYPWYSIRMPYKRAYAFAVVTLVVVVGGTSTAAFAQDARPGDMLFGIDRGLERISLALTQSEEKRNERALMHAEERLTELRARIGEERKTVHEKQEKENASTTDHVHASVEALITVMEESEMSETAREKIYEHLFSEIDDLSIEVQVDTRTIETKNERVRIEKKDGEHTSIEVRGDRGRTRIEQKDGDVEIRYERDDIDGEVRGEMKKRERSDGPEKEKGVE